MEEESFAKIVEEEKLLILLENKFARIVEEEKLLILLEKKKVLSSRVVVKFFGRS